MSCPDFFIVGAPKCGTTALHFYLQQHPEIFLPDHKEPYFFGEDLGVSARWRVASPESYRALFEGARAAQRVGEASACYLYSREAPARIRDFAADPRIIIALRNPLQMLPALHNQNLWNGNETLRRFDEAYAAQEQRAAGEDVPEGAPFPFVLQYRTLARFAEPVQRYIETLGADRVHIVVFEDLVEQPATVYQQLLSFLGVDPTFEADFTPKNVRKPAALQPLTRFLARHPVFLGRLRRVVTHERENALLDRLPAQIRRLGAPPPMSEETCRRIERDVTEDIEALDQWLGTNLCERWFDAPAGS
jgi:hypothetical protein